MCVTSMIVDHFYDKWKKIPTPVIDPPDWSHPFYRAPVTIPCVEIEEFGRLYGKAKEYDRLNNQPDCELEAKMKKLLAEAKRLYVKVDFLGDS